MLSPKWYVYTGCCCRIRAARSKIDEVRDEARSYHQHWRGDTGKVVSRLELIHVETEGRCLTI